MVKLVLKLPFNPEAYIKRLSYDTNSAYSKNDKSRTKVSYKYMYIDYKGWSHIRSLEEFNRALVHLIRLTKRDFIAETLLSIDYEYLDTSSFQFGLEDWFFKNGQKPPLQEDAVLYREKVGREGFPRNYVSGAMIKMLCIEESNVYPFDIEELNSFSANWIVNNEKL